MATEVTTTDERSAQVPALTPEGERFALRQRQARMFALSPLVPEHLRKGSPEQAIANCWIALTLAEAMGEVPLIVMQNIHVVNGKAGFASQYMIARANSSGIFKGRIDWRIDRSDPENLAVTAFAFLKETGGEVSVTCDMKMARAEGWTKNAKYQTMPEVMLRYRSAAFLVRFYAPDVMLGYQTSEEIEDVEIAGKPSAPPLNASMLIEQSKGRETIDAETGEVAAENVAGDDTPGETVAEASESEHGDSEQSASVERPTFNLGDEIGLDGPHPAQPKADEIIAEIGGANAIIDINSIVSRYGADIEAMPPEIGAKIEIAADKRKREIEAAREKAKASSQPEHAE